MDFYTKIVQYKWLCKHFIIIHKSKPVPWVLRPFFNYTYHPNQEIDSRAQLYLTAIMAICLQLLMKSYWANLWHTSLSLLRVWTSVYPVLDFIRAISVIASPLWVLLSLSEWVKGSGHTEWRTLLEDAFMGKRESSGEDLRTETGILITWDGSTSLIIIEEGKG